MSQNTKPDPSGQRHQNWSEHPSFRPSPSCRCMVLSMVLKQPSDWPPALRVESSTFFWKWSILVRKQWMVVILGSVTSCCLCCCNRATITDSLWNNQRLVWWKTWNIPLKICCGGAAAILIEEAEKRSSSCLHEWFVCWLLLFFILFIYFLHPQVKVINWIS